MKLLHPTDFSECAEHARDQALGLARALGAELILLHVSVEAPLYGEGLLGMAETERVYEAQRKWAETELAARAAALGQTGVAVRWLRRTGVPHEEIVEAAGDEQADMIVIGTHGRGGLNRVLLGSVADRVVRLAPCPVLTVRSPEGARG
jgi:nucleotide-binding universal stress UspA family protein